MMTDEQIVIFTKGLPASGKSTWARQWVNEKRGRVRINRDDLREMMGLRFQSDNEALVTKAVRNILKNSLTLGRDVVLDNTNLNRNNLKPLLEIVQQMNVHYVFKVFRTPVEACIERDGKRNNPVGEETIRNMYHLYHKQLEQTHDDDPYIMAD